MPGRRCRRRRIARRAGPRRRARIGEAAWHGSSRFSWGPPRLRQPRRRIRGPTPRGGGVREMSASPKNIYAITLFVEDLEGSKSFYQDVLGLSKMFEDEDSAVFEFS